MKSSGHCRGPDAGKNPFETTLPRPIGGVCGHAGLLAVSRINVTPFRQFRRFAPPARNAPSLAAQPALRHHQPARHRHGAQQPRHPRRAGRHIAGEQLRNLAKRATTFLLKRPSMRCCSNFSDCSYECRRSMPNAQSRDNLPGPNATSAMAMAAQGRWKFAQPSGTVS